MIFDFTFAYSLLFIVALTCASQRAKADELTDEELTARQVRIGKIDIQVDDVFETSESLSAPYRLANALHINSRAATIAAQLLFRSGDLFDRRVLDESERLLRGQRYLNAAHVEVTR